MSFVWVFNAEGGRFPGAVFSTASKAEEWIAQYGLSGVLTAYPLDVSAYDWAVREGHFRPKADKGAGFVGKFTSAYQEHHHYAHGKRVD